MALQLFQLPDKSLGINLGHPALPPPSCGATACSQPSLPGMRLIAKRLALIFLAFQVKIRCENSFFHTL